MISLFIGRFQPFHLGHLQDIKNALTFSEKVKIAIGSSQEKNTHDNPFSYEEREEMMAKVLNAEKVSAYEFFPVPDINDDQEWVAHVMKIVGDADVIYTGNEKVKDLFEESGYLVKDVTLLEGISATEIRKKMLAKKPWQKLVPKQVSDFLKKTDMKKRLRG